MKIFTQYSEIKDTLVNVEWNAHGGGFCHLGKKNWTVAHRFRARGVAELGNETEFIIRGQIALETEPRFSWLSLELFNPFEARWFLLLVKIWPGTSLSLCFNLGWRLTRASRKALERRVMEHERRGAALMKERLAQIRIPKGANNNGA